MNTPSKGIGRREFLLASSGTALAVFAFGQDAFTRSPANEAAAQLPFSLGFVDADVFADVDAKRFAPNVGAAERMITGDGSLLRSGVRVAVRQASMRPNSPNGRASVDVIAQYSIADGGTVRQLPYYVVSYRKSPGAVIVPSSFRVPLGAEQNVTLLITASAQAQSQAADGISRRNLLSSLEAGEKPGQLQLSLMGSTGPKLRRGYYIIAFTDGAAPDWSSLQLQTDLFLYERRSFETTKVGFEYIVLEVEGDRELKVRDPHVPSTPSNRN